LLRLRRSKFPDLRVIPWHRVGGKSIGRSRNWPEAVLWPGLPTMTMRWRGLVYL